jgi:anaerobic selenocysteine-containing dehydrogenase
MCIAPDLAKVHAGFARDDLFVAVQEQFMTETAKQADVLLPATMFLEHDDIYQASGHSRFQIGAKIFEPFAEARSNHSVICALAKRLGAAHPGFDMSEWQLIEDLLARSGWPDAATVHMSGGWEAMPDADTAHYRNGFPTSCGKFRFRPDWASFGDDHAAMPELPDHLANVDEVSARYPYRLVAAPARQFLNTSFTELASSRLREGRPSVKLHQHTMSRLSIAAGDLVEIGNGRGVVRLSAMVGDGQPEDVVVVESIWPNDAWHGGIGVNVLLSADAAPPNGGAAIHDTAVWLRPVR